MGLIVIVDGIEKMRRCLCHQDKPDANCDYCGHLQHEPHGNPYGKIIKCAKCGYPKNSKPLNK
jgi:hypothetical protein